MKVGDREYTLDDCWSLELNSRVAWNIVQPGSMEKQLWKGEEDESEMGSEFGAEDEDYSDEDEDDDDEDEEVVYTRIMVWDGVTGDTEVSSVVPCCCCRTRVRDEIT